MGPRRREEGTLHTRDHHALYNAWSCCSCAGRKGMPSHAFRRSICHFIDDTNKTTLGSMGQRLQRQQRRSGARRSPARRRDPARYHVLTSIMDGRPQQRLQHNRLLAGRRHCRKLHQLLPRHGQIAGSLRTSRHHQAQTFERPQQVPLLNGICARSAPQMGRRAPP